MTLVRQNSTFHPSGTKLRPALVLAETGHDDWPLCQITSNAYIDSDVTRLLDTSLSKGSLNQTSFARPMKLFTANVDLIAKRVAILNKVSLIEPEGTFLVWLDFRELGLDAKELEQFLAEEANIAVSPGYWFGREGAGFARMTIGCPRETVQRALDNLAEAFRSRHL